MKTAILRKRQAYSAAIMLFLLLLLCAGRSGAEAQESLPPWKFAVISDTQGDNAERAAKSGINDPVMGAIAADIAQESPDFVLVTGDLVNGWFKTGVTGYAFQYANWKKAMEPVYRAGIKVFPVRGNHDSGPERIVLPPLPAHLEPLPDALVLLKDAFRKAFSESYIPTNGPPGEEGFTYSFTHKNAFIVGLDQFAARQHKVDQMWLDRQLAENKEVHIFVYGHEPAFQVRHRDNLAFYPQARDTFWDAIGKAGGRVYFCGHDHLYNRALIYDSAGNPIRQIINGTGGGHLVTWSGIYAESSRIKSEYSNSDHHGYLLVALEGSRVTVAWKALSLNAGKVSWRILDYFSYALPSSAARRLK